MFTSHHLLRPGAVYSIYVSTVINFDIIFFNNVSWHIVKYCCLFCVCSWRQQGAVIFVPTYSTPDLWPVAWRPDWVKTLPFYRPVKFWELESSVWILSVLLCFNVKVHSLLKQMYSSIATYFSPDKSNPSTFPKMLFLWFMLNMTVGHFSK